MPSIDHFQKIVKMAQNAHDLRPSQIVIQCNKFLKRYKQFLKDTKVLKKIQTTNSGWNS